MPEGNVITIGTATQNYDILTSNIPKYYTIEKDGVIIISFNKKDEILKSLKVEKEIQGIEIKLTELHNNKFEQLLNKENYNLESIDDNIEKYEELKDYTRRLINAVNNNNSPEQIDIALIENDFIGYTNLGQKTRKKALTIFMEKNNRRYASIEEINNDLDIIVKEVKGKVS